MNREPNPRPGALVCAARADGVITINNPTKYNPYKQGDSPEWLLLLRRSGRFAPERSKKQ